MAGDSIFSRRLRAARELRGLRQDELAARSGLPSSMISHLERGSRTPAFDTFCRLLDVLAVSADYLNGRFDEPITVSGDSLFSLASGLSRADRELAGDFIRMLMERKRTMQ